MQPWEHRLNGLGRILPEHIEITCHRNRKSRVWNIHRLRRWGLKFIAQTLAFIAALASATISASAESRPDVLFIAIDDMNDWTTLFDPSNPIRTPNLERLAARGAFFTRAYSASPGCNPSRSAILTGLLPTTSGVYDNHRALVGPRVPSGRQGKRGEVHALGEGQPRSVCHRRAWRDQTRTRITTQVSLVDLYSTIIELAGLP